MTRNEAIDKNQGLQMAIEAIRVINNQFDERLQVQTVYLLRLHGDEIITILEGLKDAKEEK